MKSLSLCLVVALLALAGCGETAQSESSAEEPKGSPNKETVAAANPGIVKFYTISGA